jgi:hypothetical protein
VGIFSLPYAQPLVYRFETSHATSKAHGSKSLMGYGDGKKGEAAVAVTCCRKKVLEADNNQLKAIVWSFTLNHSCKPDQEQQRDFTRLVAMRAASAPKGVNACRRWNLRVLFSPWDSAFCLL